MHKWAFVGEAYSDDPWYSGNRGFSSTLATPVGTPSDPPFNRMSDLAPAGLGDNRYSYPQGSPVSSATAQFSLRSPSPSPTPSRNSITGSTLSVSTTATVTSNVTTLSSTSGIRNTMTASPVISSYPNPPFESHVVRIEKTMRIKVTFVAFFFHFLRSLLSHFALICFFFTYS